MPRGKMGRIMGGLLQEDGQGTQEDEGDADTDRGDLVSLETRSLGVGLRGGLKCQNALGKMFQ